MRGHLPSDVWESVIERIDEIGTPKRIVLSDLGLSPSTYYRRRHRTDRRTGSGRPRVFEPDEWTGRIVAILSAQPDTIGHRTVHRYLVRRYGHVPGRETVRRIMKVAGLILPPEKGRAKKRIPKIETKRPDELWMADTTLFWAGRDRADIYVVIDAHDRRVIHAEARLTQTAGDTIEVLSQVFAKHRPVSLLTDSGGEFAARDARAFYEAEDVLWNPCPTDTPEARHYVERIIKTLKEWLAWKDPQSFFELGGLLPGFITWYNEERPHSSLGDLTPAEFHRKCLEVQPV